MTHLDLLNDILLIVGAIALISAISGSWIIGHKILNRLNNPLPAPKHIASSETQRINIYYSAELQRIILALRQELHCSHVCLNRFHNGGFFANGLDMEKFTQTHETPYTIPLMQNCQGVLNSRYSLAFEILHLLHEFCVVDTSDCKDINFKNDMDRYGFKSTYLFLIKQANGTDEGFIGVNFTTQHHMTAEQKGIVKSSIPHIRDLMNLTEGILKIREN